jgi:outer membrane protein assembly factor BamB
MRRSCYLLVAMCALASTTGWGQQMIRVVGFEWRATNADLQRTSWLRVDPNISVQRISNGDFSLQWREKLDNAARASVSLSQGVTISGVYGFSTTASFIAGASNNVFAVDNDTGYPHWRRHFDAPLPAPTARCPGGITGAAARVAELIPSPLVLPPPPARGRGYYSAVGAPGEGVPMEIARRDGGAGLRGASPVPAGTAAPAPARGGGGAVSASARYTGPVYAVSSAGALHALGQVSGIDVQRPAPFLPPNTRYSDLSAIEGMLYTSTSEGCGGAANGVWAITLDDEKRVTSWATNGGSPVGQLAFTTQGKIIVAIGPGTSSGGGYSNAIVALDSKTLKPADWFLNSKGEFAATPIVFSQNGAEVVAATTTDGRVFLLDAGRLGGADHATPLFVSESRGASIAPDGLATFESNGTRWLLVPTSGALTAHKVVVAEGGKWALQQGWSSRALQAPTAPVVVNDVVFAAASGRPQGSAALYAFDAVTGRELWNSGRTISSYIPRGNLWASNSQVYVGTYDGTVYAFGPTLERR